MMAGSWTEENLQVAAIETMDTIITFCRLSNMLCSMVDSTACDNAVGAIFFLLTVLVLCRVLHRIGILAEN